MICIEYTTRLLSWTWQGETSESHRVILLENVAAWLKEQLRQLFSILKSGWNPPFCERNVHETWWRNDEVCVWLHPSLFGHGLGSDDGETCYVTLWDVSFVSFPTKPGKMRKMCKMMHVLNVLRVELWKKLDAMRHPIQAGSLSVVFPCFSKCSGHVHLYFGRYFTTEMGKLHWSGTFAATFPVTNSVLRTSFRSPTCCICATCFAVATSVNFPLHSVACDRLLRSFSFTFGTKTVIFCLKYG